MKSRNLNLLVLVALLITPVLAVAPTSNFYLVPTDMKVYSLTPYDAMVYQDGTYTIAVNRTGGIISSVLTSAHTDDVPIQAAINSLTAYSNDLGGMAISPARVIVSGNLVPSNQIVVSQNVLLEGVHCNILPVTDINLFRLKGGASIKGMSIDVHSVPGIYTKTCIEFNGSDWINDYENTRLEDVKILNNNTGGTAILFVSENAVYGNIYGVLVKNIQIYGFEYGIRIKRSGALGVNWITGNTFEDIRGSQTTHFIYMDSPGNGNLQGMDIGENTFLNINFNPKNPSLAPPIVISGFYNSLKNIMVWDWNYDSWGPAVVLTNTSAQNHIEFASAIVPSVENNGRSNSITLTFVANTGGATVISDGGNITPGFYFAYPGWCVFTTTVSNETASRGETKIYTSKGIEGYNVSVAIKKNDGSPGTTQEIDWYCGVR